MSTTQHPAYDLFDLLDDSGRALALNACINAQGSKVQGLLSKAPQLPYKPAEKLTTLTVLTAQTIAELASLQVNLIQLANGQNLREIFAQTAESRLLNLAWKALLDADVDTLCTCCSYAKNDIQPNEICVALFSKLVEGAGITLLTDGSGLGGITTGTYQGNMTFLIGEKGVNVEYKHVFNKSDADKKRWIDEHTHTSSVVTGTIEVNRFGIDALKPSAEPNKDPATVKGMAENIAAKLLDHYGKKSS